jgi:arginyl-tRNA synthetase
MLEKFKRQFAKNISEAFPESFNEELIFGLLEKPKNKSHGHLSLPVFRLSKELKKAPALIAQDLAEKINDLKLKELEKTESVSGFINFTWDSSFLNQVFSEFMSEGEGIGVSKRFKGKKLIIDYSSPNVAKPMHVGHLRATVIGQAIRNLAETQGFEVIGLNHLGDWGVQYGKLAWAYKRWGSEYDFENKAFESLYALYVRFHQEVEDHPEFEEEGAKTFKELEDGSEDLKELWKKFIDISLKEYNKTWARLGVKHDLVRGESFYSDRLEAVVKELKDKKLLTLSEGAWVVELEDDRPPCLITKSDGASLYATRDIASALYRMEELKCDVNLYVVGQEQKLHFSQVFSVLDKMGYGWSKDCHHIAFGMYRFKNQGKMSSRKGQVISLNQVLDQAVAMVKERIEEKNPNLKNKEEVSELVGVGAVVFNDLLNDRVKDVEFDWDKLTDFEGDSGPYIQYSAVRCKSLIRKSKGEGFKAKVELKDPSELRLINSILDYESVLSLSFDNFKPNYLATYLLDLSKAFSNFYNTCPILSLEDEDLKQTRLHLVESYLKVLTLGLSVLNIQVPDEM